MASKVLLGVTGGIAAYKACEVLRQLQKDGFEVRVIATESAFQFVGATTFDALTGYKTIHSVFGDPEHPIPHIEVANWCDAFAIVPCTANVAAKVAAGISDDLLTSAALVAWDKLIVAPAMNVRMYEAPSTQHNLEVLKGRGVHVIDPDSGHLADGDDGKGKLPDPVLIAKEIEGYLARKGSSSQGAADGACTSLAGKRVLVTAGPTIEWIDPVRYISNPSTGKMGYAVAEAARDAGAQVTLVSGPVALDAPSGIDTIRVETAQEMLEACERAFPGSDVAVLTAAVSDYRPKERATRKLKKATDSDALSFIEMVENPDILATLGKSKTAGQFVVGFAAETNDVVENARKKLASKGADLIVANQVGDGKGFGADGDAAIFVTASDAQELPFMSKAELASRIVDAACDNFKVC